MRQAEKIDVLNRLYQNVYDALYSTENADYSAVIDATEAGLDTMPAMRKALSALEKIRMDAITSDREIAAFGVAYSQLLDVVKAVDKSRREWTKKEKYYIATYGEIAGRVLLLEDLKRKGV